MQKKLCNKTTFPVDSFTNAGAKLLANDLSTGQPRFHAIFREADMESGFCVARDGFRVVIITSLGPYDYEKALEDCIPLGYCSPICVESP